MRASTGNTYVIRGVRLSSLKFITANPELNRLLTEQNIPLFNALIRTEGYDILRKRPAFVVILYGFLSSLSVIFITLFTVLVTKDNFISVSKPFLGSMNNF